jgi:hypothetical protein
MRRSDPLPEPTTPSQCRTTVHLDIHRSIISKDLSDTHLRAGWSLPPLSICPLCVSRGMNTRSTDVNRGLFRGQDVSAPHLFMPSNPNSPEAPGTTFPLVGHPSLPERGRPFGAKTSVQSDEHQGAQPPSRGISGWSPISRAGCLRQSTRRASRSCPPRRGKRRPRGRFSCRI